MITNADIEKGAQAASAYSSIPASDLTDLVELILRAVGFRSRQSATVRRRLRRKYKAKKEAEFFDEASPINPLDWAKLKDPTS